MHPAYFIPGQACMQEPTRAGAVDTGYHKQVQLINDTMVPKKLKIFELDSVRWWKTIFAAARSYNLDIAIIS